MKGSKCLPRGQHENYEQTFSYSGLNDMRAVAPDETKAEWQGLGNSEACQQPLNKSDDRHRPEADRRTVSAM